MRNRLPSTDNHSAAAYCTVAGHGNKIITHLCCSRECMTPLCQDCIQIHTDYHEYILKPALIRPLREIKGSFQTKIQEYMSHFEAQLSSFQEILVRNEIEIEAGLKELSNCRALLVSRIEHAFEELKREYIEKAEQQRARKEKIIHPVIKELSSVVNELEKYKTSMETDSYIEALRGVGWRDFDEDLESILSRSGVSELDSKGLKVIMDTDLDSKVIEQIKECVMIETDLLASQAIPCDQIRRSLIRQDDDEEVDDDIKASVYYTPNALSRKEFNLERESIDKTTREKFAEEMKTSIQSGTMKTCLPSCTVQIRQSTEGIEGESGFLSKSTEGIGPGEKDKELDSQNSIRKKTEDNKKSRYMQDPIPEEEKRDHGGATKEEKEGIEGEERREEEKEDDVDEVLTQQTVYSSEYSENEMKDADEDDVISSVESGHSEHIIFEEIVNSPRES